MFASDIVADAGTSHQPRPTRTCPPRRAGSRWRARADQAGLVAGEDHTAYDTGGDLGYDGGYDTGYDSEPVAGESEARWVWRRRACQGVWRRWVWRRRACQGVWRRRAGWGWGGVGAGAGGGGAP